MQILAGMWEFRRENVVMATIFSAYGGFLAAFGAIYIPDSGSSTSSTGRSLSIWHLVSSSCAGPSSLRCCFWVH